MEPCLLFSSGSMQQSRTVSACVWLNLLVPRSLSTRSSRAAIIERGVASLSRYWRLYTIIPCGLCGCTARKRKPRAADTRVNPARLTGNGFLLPAPLWAFVHNYPVRLSGSYGLRRMNPVAAIRAAPVRPTSMASPFASCFPS